MSSSVCVCRGCLATASECKLYDMRQHGLLTAYEQILQHTNSPVGEVELHPYMCSYCAAQLIKCSAFRDRCMRVRDLLQHMSLSNVELTAACINTIDRVSNKLIAPLTFDRNIYTIDTNMYTHEEKDIKEEIEYSENPCIKEPDGDQEILSEVVNNKTPVTRVKDDTSNIKIEKEHTEESFIEESASNQKILIEVQKGEAVALVRGEVSEKKNEIEMSVKNRTETNKRGKDCKNNNKIVSKKNYIVDNKRRNIKDVKNFSNSKTIKTSNMRQIINEMRSDSDLDDLLNSILGEKDKEKNEKDTFDIVSSDEKTDTEGTLTDIDTDSDIANVVKDYHKKSTTDGKKKIIKAKNKLIQKERQNKPRRTDDETFSKQYNVDIITLTKEEQRAEVEARKDSINYKLSPYNCETCFTGWGRKETLNNHLQKHNEKTGQFICDICGYRFKVSTSLRLHCSTHELKLVCRECGFVSRSRSSAQCHHKKHMGHIFTCDLCGVTHPSRSGHLSHMRLRHPDARTVACPQCGEVFLGAHGLSVHRTRTAGECQPDSRNIAEDTPSTGVECEAQIECPSCGEKFLSAASLAVHQRRVHERRLPLVPAGVSYRPRRRRPGPAHVCEVCGKTFKVSTLLKYHQMSHNGVYPYSCSLCPKRYPIKALLTMHVRVHSREKPFRCERCGRGFSLQSNYIRHVKTVHLGEKLHKCEICEKRFTEKSSVKLHVRTVHLGQPAPPRRPRPRPRPRSRPARTRRTPTDQLKGDDCSD